MSLKRRGCCKSRRGANKSRGVSSSLVSSRSPGWPWVWFEMRMCGVSGARASREAHVLYGKWGFWGIGCGGGSTPQSTAASGSLRDEVLVSLPARCNNNCSAWLIDSRDQAKHRGLRLVICRSSALGNHDKLALIFSSYNLHRFSRQELTIRCVMDTLDLLLSYHLC